MPGLALGLAKSGSHDVSGKLDIVAELQGALLMQGEHPPARTVLARLSARRIPFDNARGFTNANTRETMAALEHLR
jgi:hypothetical protein